MRTARLDDQSHLLRPFPVLGDRMIKSELVQRVAEQNPHLFNEDVKRIVNAIFDKIEAALGQAR